MAKNTFYVRWNEDGSATLLGRITAFNASGAATGVKGEGKWVQIADVSAITYDHFDLDSETPNTPVTGYDDVAISAATAILDTPDETDTFWEFDDVGYNFKFTLAAAHFPLGDRRYRTEVKVVLTGGEQFFGHYEGTTDPVRGS